MKVNKKKCKGSSKAKGHGCNDLKYIHKYGLCKQCFGHFLYNTPEGKEMLAKTIYKAKERIKKASKVKRKYIKWQDKEFKDMKIYVQEQICNPYIRMRDIKNYGRCISSGNSIIDAGHYYSKSSCEGLRFNIMNIHGQNWSDNRFGAGNLPGYKDGLIKRHGVKYFEKLEQLKVKYITGKHLDKIELIRIGKTYEQLSKKQIWCFLDNEFENYKQLFNK